MYKIILAVAIIALQWMPNPTYADTIYTWKDKNGTIRFSNEPPPEGVAASEITTPEAVDENDPVFGNKRRTSYDSMVEKASKEADRSSQERQAREAAEAAEKKRIAEEKRQERIQAERERLKEQIEAVKNRAVSPTYPNGMKQAQIEALFEKIEKLNQDAVATDKKPENGNE